MKNFWYLAAFSDELKDKLRLEIFDMDILLFRSNQMAVAVENRCCHRNVNLSLGYIQNGHITCAYHGWQYDSNGTCVHIPALADRHPIPKTARIKSYPIREINHMIWIFLGDEALADTIEIPSIPEMQNRPFVYNRHRFKADIKLVAESLFDPYHIDFLHRNSIKTFMGNLNEAPVDFNFKIEGKHIVGDYYRYNHLNFFEKIYFGSDNKIQTKFRFYLPNTAKIEIGFSKRRLHIYEHFFPIGADEVMMIQITLWDNMFTFSDSFAKWFMLRKSNKIVEEDIHFLESNLAWRKRNYTKDVFTKADEISIAFAKLWDQNLCG